MKLDISSLAHTKWKCKCHVVFAPKYRRQIIYGKIKQDIGLMLRKLCAYKEIEILEAEACKDHVHMLLSIPPKYSISQVMGYLKGKSSLMIYEKYANLKYEYAIVILGAAGITQTRQDAPKRQPVRGARLTGCSMSLRA